ncbi:MAG: nucleotidyltransferase family protein, partial [Geminicoccaceae bacterium]
MNRQADLAFLGRALSPLDAETVSALRDDLGGGTLAWESVIDLASRHLVTPVLWRGLADKGLLDDLPAEVRSYLEAVHELNGERNRRIADQLLEIATVLNRAGLEPVLLKGVAYLCDDLYGDPAARVIGDVDLLVASNQLAAAVGALAAIGYREIGLDDFSFATHHHHTPLARAHEVAAVELHT